MYSNKNLVKPYGFKNNVHIDLKKILTVLKTTDFKSNLLNLLAYLLNTCLTV